MLLFNTSNSRGAVDREFVYIELESILLTRLLFLLLPLLSLFFFSFFFFSFTHAQTRVNLQCGFPHDDIPLTVSALH